MKVAAIPWRDPTFFAFVLLGVVLLCSGALCQTKARTDHGPAKLPATVTVPPRSLPAVVQEGHLQPSAFRGSPVGPFTF
ncbi:MAG: hypothetical protein HUU35_11790 [Armatimonadetes bacterium]|nr:hypothetical protein [Armatimonadota bacterium]